MTSADAAGTVALAASSSWNQQFRRNVRFCANGRGFAIYQELINVPKGQTAPYRVHRYRTFHTGQVAVLAVAASIGAVLLTGAIAASFNNLRGRTPPAEAPLIEMRPVANGQVARFPRLTSPQWSTEDLDQTQRWHIQVGAFARAGAAEAHLDRLASTLPLLQELEPRVEEAGPVNRAQFTARDAAEGKRLCGTLRSRGTSCFVVPPPAM